MRGWLSWMQVVTSGKMTLGQVMVKGRGEDGERMSKRIFSNDAQSCVIIFPSYSYSIAK